MPASTSQRRTKPKVRRNSDVIPMLANSNRLISKETIPHTSHVPYNVEGPSHIAGIIAHARCVTRIAMLAGTGNQVSS
ncbi:hypothetical protein, partial [Bifidobacterium adolescentis]|uniref:hypothetical protein n=1 Tax=Bifidobacterium adolescentis TaxID=1680 RepID=UPI001F3FD680